MQVCHDDLAVVGARQQVVGVHAEAHRSDVTGVRLERLHGTIAANVPQHHRGVLVT